MSQPTTASLFDDEEPDPGTSLIEVLAQSKAQTKAQLSFRRLVAKIEGRREQLKQWQAYRLRYQQRLAGELVPLQDELREGQRQMALLLDELLTPPASGRRPGRVQSAKLRQLLLGLVGSLLAEEHDDALEALHDKHAEFSHSEVRQSELALTEAMLEGVFGLEVDADHGASSPEELLQHAQRKMQERAEVQARQAQERQDARAAKKRPSASSAKAEAARIKREQAAQEVSQSLREVYRKLASALHPDRETDADARLRKTALMQRVNQAYAANDLLSLLGLQLEIEQIDAEHLASVSAQRLAHFNQILREQLVELEDELMHCTLPFREAIGAGWRSATMTPAMVDQYLNADLAQLRSALRELQQDMIAFRDPVSLRESLKHYPLEQDDEPDELAALMSAFGALEPSIRGKPRRRRGT
jgi:hypothetical protein